MRGIAMIAAVASVAMAASMSSMSRGDVSFGIDTALFELDSTEMAIEVYQELEVEQLAADSAGRAYFVTQLALVNAAGDTTAADEWASRPDWARGRRLVNQTVLPVDPGSYRLEVLVTDMHNGLQGRVSRDLEVDLLEGISQIELARAVIPSGAGSQNRLLKGGMLVYPAAEGRFMLPAHPLVYVYAEIYGQAGNRIHQRTTLLSPDGSMLFARPWRAMDIPEAGNAVGLMDSISLGAARNPGVYSVEVAVASGEDTLRTRKPLAIGFQQQEGEQPGPSAGADAERRIEEMRWILDRQERELLESLESEDDRAAFYDEFWAASPEQRRQFELRCEEAERFGNQFTAGWRTDRGRVTIVYGSPDDVERETFSTDALPHEIWYYDSGNEQFVFVDRTGDGVYEQIHSTVDGEVSYDDWEEMLRQVQNVMGGGSCRTNEIE